MCLEQNKVFYIFLNIKIHRNQVKCHYPVFQLRKPGLTYLGFHIRSVQFQVKTTLQRGKKAMSSF